jgi:hypothetical protein
MKTFPDFGKELKRGFEVDQRCFDCAEFYHGCPARREDPDARCADYLRLPDVKVGTTGQTFPPSRLRGQQPRPPRPGATARVHTEAQPKNPPTSRPVSSARFKARTCGCGATLPKSKRLCDTCRTQNHRASMRQYMRGRRNGSE